MAMRKRYSVVVEGTNVYLNRGHMERMGFFTTRWIEAETKDEAKSIAIDLVRQELQALDILCNSSEDPPEFVIEEAREVDSFGDAIVPGKGFTFFPDRLAAS